MVVLGKNSFIFELTGRTCNVKPFDSALGTAANIPIVDGALAYERPHTTKTYVIRPWRPWRSKCRRCKKQLTDPVGDIFCRNFASRSDGFKACRSAWCYSCYVTPSTVSFPRVLPLVDEGVLLPEEDEDRYNHGQKRNTLMVPFQCQ